MTTLSGIGSLAAIPEEKITDKITRRVLAGQKGMMVWWKIGAGTHVAAHSHPHEQLVWIVKGRMELRIDKERRVLEPGGIAVIPSGVEHEGWCHDDTEVIDIFAPPREDFLLAADRPGCASKAEVSTFVPSQIAITGISAVGLVDHRHRARDAGA
jgi:quercetin dioxygenase-like cupin family protein